MKINHQRIGPADDQSAYRCELAGTVGMLATVAILVKQFHLTYGAITIALDGESALDDASGNWPLQIDASAVFRYYLQ